MGLSSGPLRADLMSTYSLGEFNSFSKLQLHAAARSNLCRIPTTSRVDSQRQLQSAGPKTCGSSKGSWKKQKHSEGGRTQHFDKSSQPSGSEGHGYGNFSLGQKRKLTPQEQKKKDSWIKATQKLSPVQFQQRIKTGSCINCGEQGHIFEACTKPKPSKLLMVVVDSQVTVPIIVNSTYSEPLVRKSKCLQKHILIQMHEDLLTLSFIP